MTLAYSCTVTHLCAGDSPAAEDGRDMPTETIDVGTAAEAVRRFLNANGPVAADWMYQELGLSRSLADQAIGWLAREDKVSGAGDEGELVALKS